MTEYIILILIFLTPPFTVFLKNLVWDVYFYQIKEFRFDRYWTHIRWDYEGTNRNKWLTFIKLIGFSLLIFIYDIPPIALIGLAIVWVIWAFEGMTLLSDIVGKFPVRPSVKNPRNIIIFFLCIFTYVLLHFIVASPFAFLNRTVETQGIIDPSTLTNGPIIVISDVYLALVLLTMLSLIFDLASPLISGIFVIATAPISRLRRFLTILRAKKKYATIIGQIDLVGITGSLGKTSTKEILYELIKNSRVTEKTPENFNTSFGVASAILNSINKSTEVFIAEIGAYKKNEIAEVVKKFPPDISIITDLGTQHIGLFGGEKELVKAKSEIFTEGKADGTVITNGDNEKCRKLEKVATGKFVLVTTTKKNLKLIQANKKDTTVVIFADKQSTKNEQAHYKVTGLQKDIKISIPKNNDHLLSNYLLTIAAASEIGLTPKEIETSFSKIDIHFSRISIETGDNNTIIVNDSFTSNTKGFVAAVEKVQEIYDEETSLGDIKVTGESKRILVTKGIYELGKYKRSIYKTIVTRISESIDIVISSDPLLRQMVTEANENIEVIRARKISEFIYRIRTTAQPGDIILLEGKLHPGIIQAVVSDKF